MKHREFKTNCLKAFQKHGGYGREEYFKIHQPGFSKEMLLLMPAAGFEVVFLFT